MPQTIKLRGTHAGESVLRPHYRFHEAVPADIDGAVEQRIEFGRPPHAPNPAKRVNVLPDANSVTDVLSVDAVIDLPTPIGSSLQSRQTACSAAAERRLIGLPQDRDPLLLGATNLLHKLPCQSREPFSPSSRWTEEPGQVSSDAGISCHRQRVSQLKTPSEKDTGAPRDLVSQRAATNGASPRRA